MNSLRFWILRIRAAKTGIHGIQDNRQIVDGKTNVMYPTKSDIKGFVCIIVIVNSVTKLLLGLLTSVKLLFL